jgi:hypothetical protein
MEFRDIPSIDDRFYDRMTFLRGQISSAVEQYEQEQNKYVNKGGERTTTTIVAAKRRDFDVPNRSEVERSLDGFLPNIILKGFYDWAPQKSILEESLIKIFLNTIVPITMEPERKKGQRYHYSVYPTGWCMHKSHTKKPFFIGGPKSVAHSDLYTLDELVEKWQGIFVRDQDIDENRALENVYAPRHEHNNIQVLGVLTTTRHDLRIVDSRGEYVPGTTISYARTKAGLRHLFKFTEWLTDRQPGGSSRKRIDDYLAILSRVPNPDKTWVYAMQVIDYMSKKTPGDLSDVLRLQRYSIKEAKELRAQLETDPEVGGFVSGRSDLEFSVERLARGRKNDRKFGEILIPANGNIIGYQIYNENDYTGSEGVSEQRHDNYRARREEQIKGKDGFTPWHWSIMRRLAPFFVNPNVLDTFKNIYETYLTLDYLKKMQT